jgi:tRNA nucleotidyltransferase/poly(A) polymerase
MELELINIPMDDLHPIFSALDSVQKSRSRFQLEKFVVGQHDTPEQQYKQTLLEIQSLYYTLKVINLEVKKENIQIEKLRSTGDEIDELNAQIKELNLEQTYRSAMGALQELQDLVHIWESFEHKYTQEELELAQPEYWNKRLHRQSVLESIGGTQAQASHLDALRQIGAIAVDVNGITATNPIEIELDPTKELE